MAVFILALLSAQDLDNGHVLIYLSHILSGQITCDCPRKMLLPRGQITRRKLCCFYYTCKFGVMSIKYVIIMHIILYIVHFMYMEKTILS